MHSKQTEDKILALHGMQVPSRTIAKLVLGSPTKKSTVNVIINRSQTKKYDNSRILIIPDLHAPYQHQDALAFLAHLSNKYQPTRVISLGDECFPPEVEILTDKGFIRFDNLNEEYLVGQWNEDSTIEYVQPIRKIEKDYKGDLLQLKHHNITIRCTPKHNLVKIHPSKRTVHRREAWDSIGNESWHIPLYGKADGNGVELSDDELRLMVAFQADGTFTKGAARFMFTKQRKSDRLLSLLNNCNIEFNTHTLQSGGFQYYIEKRNVPSYFTKLFNIPVIEYSLQQKEVILRELEHWDGTGKTQRVRYVSEHLSNVEYVQHIAATTGYYSSAIRKDGNCHHCDIVWNREKCSLITAKRTKIPYDGKVYCVTVPSGMIVVRIDGYVVVTGNCDKHSLSFHSSDPDLKSAGDELKAGKKFIKQLELLFPEMHILDSNHGSMVWRKAKEHGIPRQYIKGYNEVLGVSSGWVWVNDLTVDLPNGQQCYFHHGKASDVIKLSQQMGMSAVQGHYHNNFKIDYWANPNGLYFGMQSGCLINDSSYAFAYNNVNVKRPIIGASLIIDSLPVLEPMVLDTNGRWIGK